jgi:glycerate dehydrogenase
LETTAELAVALTFAAARRINEMERYLCKGNFKGWLPRLFVGEMLQRKTIGVIGAGRIGSSYRKMTAEGFKVNILYFNQYVVIT